MLVLYVGYDSLKNDITVIKDSFAVFNCQLKQHPVELKNYYPGTKGGVLQKRY